MTLIHADKETKTIISFHVIICIYQYSYQGVDARDSTRRGDVSLQEKVGGFPSSHPLSVVLVAKLGLNCETTAGTIKAERC